MRGAAAPGSMLPPARVRPAFQTYPALFPPRRRMGGHEAGPIREEALPVAGACPQQAGSLAAAAAAAAVYHLACIVGAR
jgi:hypothetical protein